MHLLRCILQGFGLAALIMLGFMAAVWVCVTLAKYLEKHFGEGWAAAVTGAFLFFLVLGTVLTLGCLGIVH